MSASPSCLPRSKFGILHIAEPMLACPRTAPSGMCAHPCPRAFDGAACCDRNVYLALNQESPWSANESSMSLGAAMAGTPRSSAGAAFPGGSGSVNEEAATRNDAAFHAYLWATMEKHPLQCQQDWCVVRLCPPVCAMPLV